MKIAIFTNGGYKGFTREITKEKPIIVDAAKVEHIGGGFKVKVADLVALDVYSILKGQVSDGGVNSFQGCDFNPVYGTLYFLDYEVEVIDEPVCVSMGVAREQMDMVGVDSVKAKVRLKCDGGYSFRRKDWGVVVTAELNRCGYVEVFGKELRAIGSVSPWDADESLAWVVGRECEIVKICW